MSPRHLGCSAARFTPAFSTRRFSPKQPFEPLLRTTAPSEEPTFKRSAANDCLEPKIDPDSERSIRRGGREADFRCTRHMRVQSGQTATLILKPYPLNLRIRMIGKTDVQACPIGGCHFLTGYILKPSQCRFRFSSRANTIRSQEISGQQH